MARVFHAGEGLAELCLCEPPVCGGRRLPEPVSKVSCSVVQHYGHGVRAPRSGNAAGANVGEEDGGDEGSQHKEERRQDD